MEQRRPAPAGSTLLLLRRREKRGREGEAISGCWLRRSCLLFAAPGRSPELLDFATADSGQRGEAAVG
ncbi:hypothetical protein KY284_035981 [Solanum tuberosum]|nr:hypothetical protein KY284_035976 [Solanum tuberosum]KAH0633195.1 hypothetical protein KY284_035981 [Solanum tuberosum]